jgi:hypothetical protein
MSIDINGLVEEAIKKEKETYESIKDYTIEIGVITADSTRKQVANVSITNAELMFIHENGSALRNLPARPVLQITIDETIKNILPKTLDRIYEGCFKQNWDKQQVKVELEKMCIRMQNYARNVIYKSNLLTPNKPSTIKAKGSDRPLLDTGQLARSITCRLVLTSEIENSS